MNDKKRFESKREFLPRQDRQDANDGEVVAKEEEWKPTDEVFAAFLVRDEELATYNLRRVLKASGYELSFRDIKEQVLHSAETIERVLAKFVKDGSVRQGQAKFGPIFSMVK